jgi:Cft2 family RNA processing exonuclease
VLPWQSPQEILPNLTVELIPAGHLPGAALILLEYHNGDRLYRVIYTGDYCLSHLQLVEGLALNHLRGLKPDVLILEGQYGTRRLPHRRQQEKQFIQAIESVLERGRNLLLPIPALGLAQEILKLLRTHHQFTGRQVNLWAGEKVIEVCNAYGEILASLPENVRNFAQHQPLFWDDRVYPHLRPLTEANWELDLSSPALVITDGWPEPWPSPAAIPGQWTVFLPQLAELPPCLENFSWENLGQFPQYELEDYLLMDHSDGRNTTQLIHNLRPQHLIFVHGQSSDIQDLTSLEELQSRYQLHSPAAGNLVALPIGDRFVQPSPPAPQIYEGEIHELEPTKNIHPLGEIAIHLDGQIIENSRWTKFAETGIVQGRWQGEELILRGISQKELFKQHQTSKRLADFDCCANCLHFQNQHCRNGASPLVGLQVRPDGHCPVFEELEEQNDS